MDNSKTKKTFENDLKEIIIPLTEHKPFYAPANLGELEPPMRSIDLKKLQYWEAFLHDNSEYLIQKRTNIDLVNSPNTQTAVSNSDPLDPLLQFQEALVNGVYPSIETLTSIQNAFASYLSAAGTISLDDAFGLKSKQRTGSPAKAYSRTEWLNKLNYEIFSFFRSNPDSTFDAAYEHIIKFSTQEEIDVPEYDSMSAYYYASGIHQYARPKTN